ncbi:HAMP domain-containing protein [Stutzerimonas xanthomarina]|uniref:HAMP domain-containing protein n=1 Tax=Stutzerimonas xanthomarina TaxID=271420 RepID=UPI003AA839F3
MLIIGCWACALSSSACRWWCCARCADCSDRLKQIADGDGDLRARLEVHSADELGQLGNALQPLSRQSGR